MENSHLQVTAVTNLERFLSQKQFSNRDLLQALHNSTEIFKNPILENKEKKIIQKTLLTVLDEVAIRFDLYTTKGFLDCYFEMLPTYKTGKETFTALNNDFEKMTGEKKYLDFKSFKEVMGMN